MGFAQKIIDGAAVGMRDRLGVRRGDRLAGAGWGPRPLRAGIRRQLHATEPPTHPGAGVARTGPVATPGLQ
ncbi:hypothetical protein G6F24_018978 [Rhizopus arrhizus]|nr:hypothetical protein G6F24_018978 [Rhizopus arrhizus]